MVKPEWKRLLSHFWPLLLERRESAHSSKLEVLLARGQILLQSQKALYSYGTLYRPFVLAFRKTGVHRMHIGSALVLGMGLGSIAAILERMHPACRITGVEIDPAVIALSEKYGSLRAGTRVQIVPADAFDFVSNYNGPSFDLVASDVFIEDQVPERFGTDAYLRGLNKLIAPGGLLLFNRLRHTAAHQREALRFFEEKFRTHFPGSSAMKLPNNLMLTFRKKQAGLPAAPSRSRFGEARP